MESVTDVLDDAKRELRLADHITYVTFPLVKDKKLFASAIRHLNQSIIYMIKAFLINERLYKRIRSVPIDSGLQIRFFIDTYKKFFKISDAQWIIDFIRVSKNLETGVKVEREDEVFILTSELESIRIGLPQLKKYLSLAKTLINKIDGKIK
ncbi:MAG: hypothetical protein GOU97_04670 [Nanoarchaeota archaeon]|nr:hypothetical protein [Nanoarchaeota archaeon]